MRATLHEDADAHLENGDFAFFIDQLFLKNIVFQLQARHVSLLTRITER